MTARGVQPHEPALICSKDAGNNWRLLQTNEIIPDYLEYDINKDFQFDYKDIVAISNNWLEDSCDSPADLDDNCFVNFSDFLIFSKAW